VPSNFCLRGCEAESTLILDRVPSPKTVLVIEGFGREPGHQARPSVQTRGIITTFVGYGPGR